MTTFIKANIASLTASFVDYVMTILLISIHGIDIVVASAIGTICGGIVNFLIGRRWVFVSREEKVQTQATKYLIVWVGNLFLNTGGMYLFAKVLGVQYIISKVFVSLSVGFFYNYVLQKKYVFKKD